MNSFKDSFRSWFGYSRRERRSAFILLIIIVIILLLRYIIPAQSIALKEIPLEFQDINFDSILVSEVTNHVKTQEESQPFRRKRPLIDLNSCDSVSLLALPGIGPVLSSRIVRYRNLIGGYISVDQLKEVYGLPPETLGLISSRLFADSLAIRKIKINEAEYKELIRHPYFKRSEVVSIMKYRELKGNITGISDLTGNNLVSSETAKKIRPYLDFGD